MIDARGRSCPEPLLMIKKAMGSGADEYEMLVDCTTALENVTRFVQHNGYTVETKQDGGEYTLHIRRK